MTSGAPSSSPGCRHDSHTHSREFRPRRRKVGAPGGWTDRHTSQRWGVGRQRGGARQGSGPSPRPVGRSPLVRPVLVPTVVVGLNPGREAGLSQLAVGVLRGEGVLTSPTVTRPGPGGGVRPQGPTRPWALRPSSGLDCPYPLGPVTHPSEGLGVKEVDVSPALEKGGPSQEVPVLPVRVTPSVRVAGSTWEEGGRGRTSGEWARKDSGPTSV